MVLNNIFFCSPFEQFDSITWVIVENLLESKVHLEEYIYYSITSELAPITSQNKIANFRSYLAIFYIFISLIVVLSTDKNIYKTITNYLSVYGRDFSFIFFFIFFFFISGGLLTFWFADVSISFTTEENFHSYADFSFIGEFLIDAKIYPQINFALLLDENLVSFFAAFLLFTGAEESEDEDFILEEEESDFIGDVVAPLFISNLGKDVEDNGALFLKVSSIFGFILLNNLMGMLPYSDTGTSSLLLTFWVALSVFVSLLTLMITKHGVNYLFSLFLPHGTPFALIFLLVPIEFISYTFRLLSLSVRLFANMMAGHTLLKVIVGFSWTMILMGDFFLVANIFPIGILFALIFLELGVALIQAYVFTILTCMYLKDIFVGH